MAREGAHYTALNGAKLEYSTTKTGSYTQIYGLKTIPEIGGEPNDIDEMRVCVDVKSLN